MEAQEVVTAFIFGIVLGGFLTFVLILFVTYRLGNKAEVVYVDTWGREKKVQCTRRSRVYLRARTGEMPAWISKEMAQETEALIAEVIDEKSVVVALMEPNEKGGKTLTLRAIGIEYLAAQA